MCKVFLFVCIYICVCARAFACVLSVRVCPACPGWPCVVCSHHIDEGRDEDEDDGEHPDQSAVGARLHYLL